MEKFGQFQFKIYKNEDKKGFSYQIFNNDNTVLRESKEFFSFEGIARFAAIGHITLLEKKEG